MNGAVANNKDFAELRALNQQIMTTKDWLKQIENFSISLISKFYGHAGQISHSMALAKAEEEYEKISSSTR